MIVIPKYVTSWFTNRKEMEQRLALLVELGCEDIGSGREYGQWYTRFKA